MTVTLSVYPAIYKNAKGLGGKSTIMDQNYTIMVQICYPRDLAGKMVGERLRELLPEKRLMLENKAYLFTYEIAVSTQLPSVQVQKDLHRPGLRWQIVPEVDRVDILCGRTGQTDENSGLRSGKTSHLSQQTNPGSFFHPIWRPDKDCGFLHKQQEVQVPSDS